jgi:ABC-2 type transport system permease protein
MPRGAIIAGKMLTYTLVVLLQVALLFGVGNVAFDMPLGESPLGLLILSLALALTASALGMLLAALSKTSSQAETLGMVGGFVLGGLGGTVIRFPPDSFMSQLSLLTPQGHALRGFDSLLINGGSVVDILPQAGILVGFTVVFFVVAMRRFKFE